MNQISEYHSLNLHLYHMFMKLSTEKIEEMLSIDVNRRPLLDKRVIPGTESFIQIAPVHNNFDIE